jgi:DnaB-like helicase C terminal domain
VGLLVRPEYYETDEDAKEECAGEAELIVAKQRNGPTGEVKLTFLKQYTRFENRSVRTEPPSKIGGAAKSAIVPSGILQRPYAPGAVRTAFRIGRTGAMCRHGM